MITYSTCAAKNGPLKKNNRISNCNTHFCSIDHNLPGTAHSLTKNPSSGRKSAMNVVNAKKAFHPNSNLEY
jgi:hypothetical protein